MQIFTKHQIIEVSLRPLTMTENIKDRLISKFSDDPTYKLIRILRQSTKLNVCLFAPDKFIIKY